MNKEKKTQEKTVGFGYMIAGLSVFILILAQVLVGVFVYFSGAKFEGIMMFNFGLLLIYMISVIVRLNKLADKVNAILFIMTVKRAPRGDERIEAEVEFSND